MSVFIQDVNDEAPRIDLVPELQRDARISTGRIRQRFSHGLFLTDPGDASGLHVDSHTRIDELGEIIVSKTLDHVWLRTLTIVAVDRGDLSLSSSSVFNVIIQDRNDVVPRFDQVTYSASVAESEGAGVSVVKVTALDVDKDSRLRYSINSVYPSSLQRHSLLMNRRDC